MDPSLCFLGTSSLVLKTKPWLFRPIDYRSGQDLPDPPPPLPRPPPTPLNPSLVDFTALGHLVPVIQRQRHTCPHAKARLVCRHVSQAACTMHVAYHDACRVSAKGVSDSQRNRHDACLASAKAMHALYQPKQSVSLSGISASSCHVLSAPCLSSSTIISACQLEPKHTRATARTGPILRASKPVLAVQPE